MNNISHYLLYALLIITINLHAADNQLTELDRELLAAIEWDEEFENIKNLLDRDAQVNARDKEGRAALAIAASRGRIDIARELISRGADVHARTGFDRTVLHIAAAHGHAHIVRDLIGRGADVHAKDGFEETALHTAAFYGRLEVVQTLLALGANVKAKNDNGRTPEEIAREEEHGDIANYIRDYKIDDQYFNNQKIEVGYFINFNGSLKTLEVTMEDAN